MYRWLIFAFWLLLWASPLQAQAALPDLTAFIAARYQPGDMLITDAAETDLLASAIAAVLPEAQVLSLTQVADGLPTATRLFFMHTNPAIAAPDTIGTRYMALEKAQFGDWQLIIYQRTPGQLQPLARFGDAVWLLGWRLDRSARIQPCDTLRLESWWQITAPVPQDYSMTLTVNNLWGTGINRTDGAPANSQMRLWQLEQVVIDIREVMIPCDTPPGEYFLVVGIYDWANGDQLPVFPDGYYRAHLTGFKVVAPPK